MHALALALLIAQAPATGSPAEAVQGFYTHIIRHRPVGIPTGEVRRALWPLLSARLARHLDTLQACEADYYRRNKRALEAEQHKPSIGWLEQGLFSGGNEQALPAEAVVTRVERVNVGRFRVHVEFTYRDTFETYRRPPDDSNAFQWPGIVMVTAEAGGYAIDDYVPVDAESGRTLTALSEDFRECRGPRWIGLEGERN